MAKADKTTIETVIKTRYGVDAMQADAITVEWAAEHLAGIVGTEVAGAEWKRFNRKRERVGRYTTIPRYKSPLWESYFGKATA